eukprot:3243497-Pleurochrysis_carterae.AAC.2
MPLSRAILNDPDPVVLLYSPLEPAKAQTLIDSLQTWLHGCSLSHLSPEAVLHANGAVYLPWEEAVVGPLPRGKPPSGYSERESLDCLALALHLQLLARCASDPAHVALRLRARRLHVRVHAADETPLRYVKADKIGRLVAVTGSVIRVSSLRPFVTAMSYSCARCGRATREALVDGKYRPPTACAHGCGAKSLSVDRPNAAARDWQKIRLQEIPGDDLSDFYGRVPRTVEARVSSADALAVHAHAQGRERCPPQAQARAPPRPCGSASIRLSPHP